MIQKLSQLYTNKQAVQKKIKAIQKAVWTEVKRSDTKDNKVSLSTLENSLKKSFDATYAGFGDGRKFPEAAKLSLMMDIAALTKDTTLKNYSFEMLDAMALRGLYDHIGGGFFRYSVNKNWEIPHFEKMLYNQAELIPLYVLAHSDTNQLLIIPYSNLTIEKSIKASAKF